MNTIIRKTAPFLLSILLAGPLACTGDSDEPEEEQQGAFDPLVDTLDKAQQAEQEVQQRVDELNKALKEAEGERDDEDGGSR